jgi:hypothetical protein
VNAAKHSIRREPSARSGWLSWLFGDDTPAPQANRRRLLFAFAVAIAIHEIAAGVVPWHTQTLPPAPVETLTIAKITRIEHRATPTPRPTPAPTPKPIVHAKVIAETHVTPRIINPGNPSQHQHVKRIASARPLVHTRFHSRAATIHVPTGGHGAGTSKNAKALTGGIGPGGNGTGESGTGSGTGGAPAAHEPCGFVDFFETEDPTIDSATGRIWEHIMIKVHFPDGTEQSVPLDYAFYYPSKDQDPFQQTSTKEAAFQFPPPDKRADEPPLVQYVMDHTTSAGFTKLHECPGASGTS